MTTVTENGTFVLATYVWDPLSRRASLAYGNGTTQSYSYSKAGDLETHTHTITGNSNTWTNSYTKAHQLLSEAASNAAWVFQPAVNETTSYGSANNLNQYVTVTHAANPMATLYYDGNGNLIDDGAWDFEYDAENRLTKASNPTTGTTAQYLYDPMGRRQAKIVGSVTTSFLSDGAEEIAEYDGAGGLLRRYIPGPDTDQPIAMVTPSGGSHLHSYFHTNRQGSTVAMSNDAGTVSEGPYTYDAYGQGAPSTGVPFKYTGRRLDPETGLYYYRARYYSANLGRFLQTDPIGYKDQMNLYGYVNNDPGNATDPSGKCPDCRREMREEMRNIVSDQIASSNQAMVDQAPGAAKKVLGAAAVVAVGGAAVATGSPVVMAGATGGMVGTYVFSGGQASTVQIAIGGVAGGITGAASEAGAAVFGSVAGAGLADELIGSVFGAMVGGSIASGGAQMTTNAMDSQPLLDGVPSAMNNGALAAGGAALVGGGMGALAKGSPVFGPTGTLTGAGVGVTSGVGEATAIGATCQVNSGC